VHAAAFSSDGRRLITVGRDKTIRTWNGTPGGMARELAGHIERPSEAVFSPDSRRIVGRGPRGTTVWEVATGAQVAILPAQGLRHAVFLDGSRVAAHTGQLHIWDTASGAVTVIDGDHERLAFVAASADRKQIALYGALHLWNAQDNAAPVLVDADLGLMSSAAFSPDGQRLAVTSTAGLHLIDPVNRKQIAALDERNPTLESAAYSRGGRTLFVGSRKGELRALDSVTLKTQYTWPLGDAAIIDLSVSPDDARLLAVTQNGMRIFDIATREEVAVLDTSSSVTQAAFSPDGRSIATNSEELRIWPAFPTTQDLVDFARSVMPRELTVQQRKEFFLDASTSTPPAPAR
jgi:WD40 repeat protein